MSAPLAERRDEERPATADSHGDRSTERRPSAGRERPSGHEDRRTERRPSGRSERPSGEERGHSDRSGERGPSRERGASSYGRGAGARSGGPRAGASGGGRSSERTTGRSRPTEGVPVARVAEPPLSDDITTAGLDPEVRRDLRGLQKDTADSVARHLVAAGMLVDDDPELALEHARFARTRASRIAVVREAAGIAAYHAGEWAEALGELRAARRMGGGPGHLAVMADIERALGRPERALDLSRGPEVRELDRAEAIELLIVAAGARRDLGELDAAVIGLQVPELDPARREPWSGRLFYAHADNLLAAGRESDALEWFVHAANADVDGETDAEHRIAELTGEPLLPEDDVEFGPEALTDLPSTDTAATDEAAQPSSDRRVEAVDVADVPAERGDVAGTAELREGDEPTADDSPRDTAVSDGAADPAEVAVGTGATGEPDVARPVTSREGGTGRDDTASPDTDVDAPSDKVARGGGAEGHDDDAAVAEVAADGAAERDVAGADTADVKAAEEASEEERAGDDVADGAVAGDDAADDEPAGGEIVKDDTAADGTGEATIGDAAGAPADSADSEVRGDPAAPRGDARL